MSNWKAGDKAVVIPAPEQDGFVYLSLEEAERAGLDLTHYDVVEVVPDGERTYYRETECEIR